MKMLVFLTLLFGTFAHAAQYEFFLNDKPVIHRGISLNATPDDLRAGDLVYVAGMNFVLGEPGTMKPERRD